MFKSLSSGSVQGRYGFPALPSCEFIPGRLIPYSSQVKYRRLESLEICAVHFWIQHIDHLWNFPNRSLDSLRRFPCVLAPGVALRSDQPFWKRVMLHGLRQDLVAYWVEQGLRLMPVVDWCDRTDFEFCFDGIPRHSVIAVRGVERSAKELPDATAYRQSLLLEGLELVQVALQPKTVVFCGGSERQRQRAQELLTCPVVQLPCR